MKKTYADKIIKMSHDGYEDIAKDFASTRKVFWKELYFLGEYIKNGNKVLDLGCGNGRFLEVIGKKIFQYVGIDNSESLISYAKKQYGKERRFICGDALKLPFVKDEFDIIVSFGVIHHIPSKKYRVQFMDEASRTLKKDGVLILTVWNLWNKRLTPVIKKHTLNKIIFKSKLDFKDVFLPFGKKQNVRYLHAFTERELRELIKKSGFYITKLEKIKRRGDNENIVAICKKI